MTAEIAEILHDMELFDQHVWLGRRETLDQYDHFIIDGAHRVTLGKLHFPESDKGGYFMLLHPSVSYEDRDSLAVSGNEIAETTNKTTFLDRCVMVYKKIKEGKTIKAIHGVLTEWGKYGYISQIHSVVKSLDQTCWAAMKADYTTRGAEFHKPILAQSVLMVALVKGMPDEIRGATMMDMVVQTKDNKCHPGCGLAYTKNKVHIV